MKNIIVLFAIIKFVHSQIWESNDSLDFLSKLAEIKLSEDGRLNFTQLVKKYGHDVEQYDLLTEDGYILTFFHIPGDKSPVLLLHALGTSGDIFHIRGKDSLGITLADEGYDVWVLNNRGNLYGRRHAYLDPDTDKDKFWDFSFHEMGYYDFAAAIDFVRKQTGEEQIFCIGWSQGAIQPLSLMSLRPEYNERVKLFIALAPGAYFYNMPPLFQVVAGLGPIFLELLDAVDVEELFNDRGVLVDAIRTICSSPLISYPVCAELVIFPVAGLNPAGLEPEFLPTLVGHAPAAVSRKSVTHYDQLYFSKKFRQYDYGTVKNLVKYGSPSPPEYDLGKVTGKFALIGGAIDKIVLIENLRLLRKNLPNVVHYEEIPDANHNDVAFGKEGPKNVFPSILKLLKEYDDK